MELETREQEVKGEMEVILMRVKQTEREAAAKQNQLAQEQENNSQLATKLAALSEDAEKLLREKSELQAMR